jgi:hypothetical protein
MAIYSKTCFVKLVALVKLHLNGRQPQICLNGRQPQLFINEIHAQSFSKGIRLFLNRR